MGVGVDGGSASSVGRDWIEEVVHEGKGFTEKGARWRKGVDRGLMEGAADWERRPIGKGVCNGRVQESTSLVRETNFME